MVERALARRAGWSLGDQVLASATNFGLLVVVARSVSPSDFGLFAILMAAYGLVAYVGRGLTSDPLVTRYSAAGREQWAGAVRGSLAAAVATGVAVAAAVALTAVALPGGLREATAAFAVVVPGVLLQDHLRFAFFSSGRAAHAFVNDLVWTLAQLGAIGVALMVGSPSVATLVLLWGASGTLAALIGLVQVGVLPDPRRLRWWFAEHRDLWGFYSVENGLMQVTNILVLAILGAVGGLAAAGTLRAAVAIFGPLIVLGLGVMAIGVPELARLAARNPAAVPRASLAIGGLLGLVTLLWGAGALLLPDQVGAALFGETWALAHPILLFTTIDGAAAMFVLGPFMGLRALGSARRSLGVRSALGLGRLAVASVGAALGGVSGAAIGFAVAAPVQVVAWSGQVVAAGKQPATSSSSPSPREEV